MSTLVLDHIVHLTPPGTVELVSSEFRKLGFNVIPGGTHIGGLTYNALVILADGVYLELIAFVEPDPPSSHRWGRASPGWIDFAFLGLSSDVDRVINERAAKDKSGVTYLAGVDGGRHGETPQGGKTLKWRVTAPGPKHGIGRLPFFCQDVTPREWRVPQAKAGHHSSTAQGISHIRILAKNNAVFKVLLAQLGTVVGSPPSSLSTGLATWYLGTPMPIPGLHTKLILEETTDLSKGSGIQEVGFWVKDGHGGKADSPYGKIIWTPLP